VQADHTRVDLMLVDTATRAPLGRPWLTLVLDVCTRCVLGLHVAFDAPSSAGVAHDMAQAVLRTPTTVRTSAITIINLELGQPNIIHRPFAAQSAQQRECGGAAPLTLRLPTLRCSPLSWVRQNYFHLLDFSSARLAESGF